MLLALLLGAFPVAVRADNATPAPRSSYGPTAAGLHTERPALPEVHPAKYPQVPADLHAARTAAECSQHSGNFACAALAGGALTVTVLLWDGESAADAYTVYRTVRERAGYLQKDVPVGSNTGKFNGAVPTAFALDSVAAGDCFVVTERRSGLESPASAAFCPPVSARSVTLTPTHLSTYETTQYGSCSKDDDGQYERPPTNVSGFLTVGYTSRTIPCGNGGRGDGTMILNTFDRGGAVFNVTALTGREILRAMLVLPSTNAAQGDATSCLASVSNGSATTPAGPPLLPGEPAVASTQAGEVDVTPIVAAWVSGSAANNGFVLQAPIESGSGPIGNCLRGVTQPTLAITLR